MGFTRCLNIAPEKIFTVGTECNEKFVFNSETNVKILVPPAKSPSYIDVLNEIIEKYDVDFLHVQPDVEVGVLSENREKIKCSMFLPSKETIKMKLMAYQSLAGYQYKDVRHLLEKGSNARDAEIKSTCQKIINQKRGEK